eukprot:TRINITY_DN5145_c0_g2_i2.p1 TRINITY_DN5145_c0_g2~~TRINITY_DN5145_c0_g2_i2.p1  ORF type:complete len:142 (+),score=22.99 TRINITY_DN5145_c0_g2_i2:398-823(+)
MQFWDIDTSSRFRSIVKTYYRGAHGIVFIFDITRPFTFEGINFELAKLDESHRYTEKVLVGNKCDLSSQRMVSTEEAEVFAKANGMRYYETSALIDTNISLVFDSIAAEIKAKIDSKQLSTKPYTPPARQNAPVTMSKSCF